PAAQAFVEAAEAAGFKRGDYNGRDRGGAAVTSLLQTTTKEGKRSSTYQAFLAGEPEHRPNLTIITHAVARKLILEGVQAKGVVYRTSAGEVAEVRADREVILSAGAIGSPHLLMLSGIGPRAELEAAGVACVLDQTHVGKHLKDHLQIALFFP